MRDNLRARIEGILSKRLEKSSDHADELAERRLTDNSDLRRFFDLKENVIRPKVLEFIKILRDQGIFSRVTSDESVFMENGQKLRSSNITLSISDDEKSADGSSDFVSYCIRWDGVNGHVKFVKQGNKSGRGGSRLNEYDSPALLHDITSDLIEDRLFNFVQSLSH